MCALMRLRFLTAQRGGELAGLRWTDVEGDWLTILERLLKTSWPIVSRSRRLHKTS